MIEFLGLDNIRSGLLRNPVVTLGTFDGVHLGHRKVIEETIKWARETDGQSVLITFDRHPRAVLRHEPTQFITSLEHRLELFRELGIDCAIVLRFHTALADMPAERFAREVLSGAIGARRVVLGYDHRFGRGGAGNIETLRNLTAEDGSPLFETRKVPAVFIDGERVSSTKVRKAVEAGDMQRAAKFLGRPYSVMGTVIHGDSRGHEIGYPTANLNLHHEISPPSGVYHTRVLFKTGKHSGRRFESATYIGTRPTFLAVTDEAPLRVEVHILDRFDNNVYGERMEVMFIKRLRDEEKFSTPGALAEAIKNDIARLKGKVGSDPI
jgi:riboflavin kinase/FMN adenylyltransferase